MKSAVQINRLTFAYPPLAPDVPVTPVFDALNLHVAAGDTLTIAGANGSGKSTLCHLLAGLAPKYTGGQLEGDVRVLDSDITAHPPAPDRVGVLFQDAATQLFNNSAEHEIAWGLEAIGTPALQIGPQVVNALQRFGLLGARQRPPWQLSGGQQKRLALATLWALHPRLLLLDEPLGGLDPDGRQEVRAALEHLRQGGSTLLFTAPHLQSAALTERVALIETGILSEPLSAAQVYTQEARLHTVGLRCPPEAWQALDASRHPSGAAPALELHSLRHRYPDGPAVLHGIDLAIPQGQFVALIGPNGAGKSTLIRHFNGLLRPTAGAVHVLGQSTAKRTVGELARHVGFLFQRPEQQLFATTVREEIAYGPRHLGMSDAEQRTDRALAHFDLETLATLPPAILGYGTQRAITLASLNALDTPILVLDEPAVGLDGQGWRQLLLWLAERRAAGTTILVVTHEMSLAAHADRVIALEGGRVIADAPPADILPPAAFGALR